MFLGGGGWHAGVHGRVVLIGDTFRQGRCHRQRQPQWGCLLQSLSVQRQERVVARQGAIGRDAGHGCTVEHEPLFKRQHLRRLSHQAVTWCFCWRFGVGRLLGQ